MSDWTRWDRVRHGSRAGTILRIVEQTARVGYDDGSEGYALLSTLARIHERPCTRAEALAFVARAETEAAGKGGHLIQTPLRVLRALATP